MILDSSLMHVPVLLERVVELLALRPGANVIDCTVDGGGYAEAILEATAPSGELIGLDADPSMLEISRERLARFGSRARLRELNFRHLRIASGEFGKPIHAVIADLGMSSIQLDDPKRGLSFLRSGPLDMRFSPKTSVTAAMILNEWREFALRDLFQKYGQEPAAARLARALVLRRRKQRFVDTADLADTVARAVGRRGKIHPATRVFQALRIAVNDELGALTDALPQMLHVLAPKGRLVILSYHSLEDRLVKRFFKERAPSRELTILTKKPLSASGSEIAQNPRARSAKLRAAEKN